MEPGDGWGRRRGSGEPETGTSFGPHKENLYWGQTPTRNICVGDDPYSSGGPGTKPALWPTQGAIGFSRKGEMQGLSTNSGPSLGRTETTETLSPDRKDSRGFTPRNPTGTEPLCLLRPVGKRGCVTRSSRLHDPGPYRGPFLGRKENTLQFRSVSHGRGEPPTVLP